jgi:hypothetical protein
MTQPTCTARIFTAHTDLTRSCSRRGVVSRNGQWWCKQHDPVEQKARADAGNLRLRHASQGWQLLDAIKRAETAVVAWAEIHHPLEPVVQSLRHARETWRIHQNTNPSP